MTAGFTAINASRGIQCGVERFDSCAVCLGAWLRNGDAGSGGSGSEEAIADGGEAAKDHEDAGGEEDHVPEEMVAVLVDVMKLKELVIDEAFDEIEEAPSEEEGADERFAG